jgi:hypothetical protein
LKDKDQDSKTHSSMSGNSMSYRQLKAFISWARREGILQLEVEGIKVTFNPSAQINYGEDLQGKVTELLPSRNKSKEDLLREEDDLLYASAL